METNFVIILIIAIFFFFILYKYYDVAYGGVDLVSGFFE